MKLRISAVLTIIALLFSAQLLRGNPPVMSAETFMQQVRLRAAMQESFADLRGRISHMRRNQGGAKHYPIRFVILFNNRKTEAQLTLNTTEQHYFKRDNISAERIVESTPQDNTLLNKLGFRIEDLTLDFLSFPIKQELPGETVKTVNCRVLELLSSNGGLVRVWIARDYYFPLKAMFFLPGAVSGAPADRTLEITGFKQFGKYYAATDIALFSSSYRTRIAFDNCLVVKSDDPRAKAEFKRKK